MVMFLATVGISVWNEYQGLSSLRPAGPRCYRDAMGSGRWMALSSRARRAATSLIHLYADDHPDPAALAELRSIPCVVKLLTASLAERVDGEILTALGHIGGNEAHPYLLAQISNWESGNRAAAAAALARLPRTTTATLLELLDNAHIPRDARMAVYRRLARSDDVRARQALALWDGQHSAPGGWVHLCDPTERPSLVAHFPNLSGVECLPIGTPGADTDGDGLDDQTETLLGTLVRNPDSDGDGLDDAHDSGPLARAPSNEKARVLGEGVRHLFAAIEEKMKPRAVSIRAVPELWAEIPGLANLVIHRLPSPDQDRMAGATLTPLLIEVDHQQATVQLVHDDVLGFRDVTLKLMKTANLWRVFDQDVGREIIY